MEWGFYGRREHLRQLEEVLARGRWFFARVTGRRRIGKTTLIQQALRARPDSSVLYVQIPDSAPAGVVSAAVDAMDLFQIDTARFSRPHDLASFARLVSSLARAGTIVVLDEFQYFNRERLADFPSLLQREVDGLANEAGQVRGGLIVLGSIHTEIQALLANRQAPLYARTTDEIDVGHLDIGSILEILRDHADTAASRLLLLWALFEGVPKFYRDCYEQGVLGAEREALLRKIFFESSSPLRTEADNWFLKELHGRYDLVLKFVARHPGCTHGDVLAHTREMGGDSSDQVGGYLKVLIERYRLIEKRLPVFAKPRAPKGRYYVGDNFLAAWLAALAIPIAALAFSPVERMVAEASRRLEVFEGHAFERLVAHLYEERSKKQVGDFALSSRIEGYWDSADTEIDLVAVDEPGERIRFGTCKRSEAKLRAHAADLKAHADRFLAAHRRFASWRVEHVALAPEIGSETRASLDGEGFLVQDLNDLTAGL